MRTLLIDNYDSYTYNLFHLIAKAYDTEPVVVTNDDPQWNTLNLTDFDAVIISPGPGHPGKSEDFGHSATALSHPGLPVLGVCLGHQGIGLAAGATVQHAPQPRHGHLTTVNHKDSGIFTGIPQGFTAVRYHSLCVADPLPDNLEVLARSEDGVIMGLQHRQKPWWGVQFHPESICTECGIQLMANFADLAQQSGWQRTPRSVRSAPVSLPTTPNLAAKQVTFRCLEQAIDAEAAFLALCSNSNRAFWLDSARIQESLSRFSFFGEASNPGDEVLSYRVDDDSVIVAPYGQIPYQEKGSIFDALRRRIGREMHGAESLPFDLAGGYVGYFGYELKAILGGQAAHKAETPDAMWLQATRFIAVDHQEHKTYIVAITDLDAADSAEPWLDCTVDTLQNLSTQHSIDDEKPLTDTLPAEWLIRSREQYLTDINECDRQLRAGESYEICLTNQLRLPAPENDLAYYLRLRRLNPAPYGALLRLGELTVFCSSPERFLRIDRHGTAESRPIKGTSPRHTDPRLDEQARALLQADSKTRAENLMIVDLLRNDLGKVCEVDSVEVPRLMTTESYATVHQLESTIHGKLRTGLSTVDCIQACFPGGSMTGAPKIRTMNIIDKLETTARGIYSGALGYLSYNGTADLNIVIRTAVRWWHELTVGAGGAIVLDSDPEAEYNEMLLKAAAPLRALPRAHNGTVSGLTV